jgi:hypothetical protein
LLSPVLRLSQQIKSSRRDLDIAVVYAWDQPLSLLYQKTTQVNENIGNGALPAGARRTRRNKGLPTYISPRPSHSLNTHALLHIRNFWHRHLIVTSCDLTDMGIRENTYWKMAKALMGLGIAPRRWDKQLKDDDNLNIALIWYGHYSTLPQWPQRRQQLEEGQSMAEDWETVDPLVRKLHFPVTLGTALKSPCHVQLGSYRVFPNLSDMVLT